MSDVTVETLLEHADWIDGCGHGLGPGEALRAEAARLEAESAHHKYVEQLAKAFRERMVEVGFLMWKDMNEPAKAAHLAGIAAVLDRLAADGRLLPEGGTVLTYDEGTLHRVYAALGNAGLSHRVAEDVVNEMQNLGILFRERTSSESQNGLDFDVPPAVSVPDSGPDGTPEKPWPTWQEVPDDVKYQSANSLGPAYVNHNGEPFVILGGIATRVAQWCAMDSAAPFLRVDGDGA